MNDKSGSLSYEQVSTILGSISDGVFTVDKEWRITSFNRAAEEITGIPGEEAIGKFCCEVFRSSICETDCALRTTLETGKPIVNKTIYIIDAEGERVPISISTAILKDNENRPIGGVETFRDLSQMEELRKELNKQYTFADIISKNNKIHLLFDILPRIAASDSTVLIEGESGTGKELFARAIHNLSPREQKPFVAVNCSALPDTLLESELFGYKAGAFTDAKKDKPGRFALAEGGTLFLDEIGDISPALQVRFLRFLQDKTYEPLGATQSLKSNVRIVAATNKKLAGLVEKGEYRRDLFYRIHVVSIQLPPLRERKEDIPLLIEHFIYRFNRLREKDIIGVSGETMEILFGHDYPGNIRELENIIEHAFVLCPGDTIELHHLPDYLYSERTLEKFPPSNFSTLKHVEKRMIFETLQRNHWNRKAAAEELGIHKSTLFRKIRNLDIELPDKDGRSSK